jgi:protoporphyrin/coproporphyrin ferrochelatase
MPRYLGTDSLRNGAPTDLAVLVVNLGTPDAPNTPEVRRYLREFLGDPRVIEAPRWWWLPVLQVILRIRPSRSAHAYRAIWTPNGSPQLVLSRELTAAIGERLGQGARSPSVVLGMTYGKPALSSVVDELQRRGIGKLVVLPLFPQYSATTTAAVFDQLTRSLQQWRYIPELCFISDYHDDPAYITALAQSVRDVWSKHGRKHLFFSFHGLPKSYVQAGDPYQAQCLTTAKLVAEQLELAPDVWSLGFQSRVGRTEWLRPYTEEMLVNYAKLGPKDITVICPGFAVDCLETLEEIELRNREAYLAAGGQSFDYVPALNAQPQHAALLADLIARRAGLASL